MANKIVGARLFFDFLDNNLPKNYKGSYSDGSPSPMHYFIYKVDVVSKKVLFGLLRDEDVKTTRVAELKVFPGCQAAERFNEDNDQQRLHIIVMEDEADDAMLELADAFEDVFDLEATIEDSPSLLAEIMAKRDNSQETQELP